MAEDFRYTPIRFNVADDERSRFYIPFAKSILGQLDKLRKNMNVSFLNQSIKTGDDVSIFVQSNKFGVNVININNVSGEIEGPPKRGLFLFILPSEGDKAYIPVIKHILTYDIFYKHKQLKLKLSHRGKLVEKRIKTKWAKTHSPLYDPENPVFMRGDLWVQANRRLSAYGVTLHDQKNNPVDTGNLFGINGFFLITFGYIPDNKGNILFSGAEIGEHSFIVGRHNYAIDKKGKLLYENLYIPQPKSWLLPTDSRKRLLRSYHIVPGDVGSFTDTVVVKEVRELPTKTKNTVKTRIERFDVVEKPNRNYDNSTSGPIHVIYTYPDGGNIQVFDVTAKRGDFLEYDTPALSTIITNDTNDAFDTYVALLNEVPLYFSSETISDTKTTSKPLAYMVNKTNVNSYVEWGGPHAGLGYYNHATTTSSDTYSLTWVSSKTDTDIITYFRVGDKIVLDEFKTTIKMTYEKPLASDDAWALDKAFSSSWVERLYTLDSAYNALPTGGTDKTIVSEDKSSSSISLKGDDLQTSVYDILTVLDYDNFNVIYNNTSQLNESAVVVAMCSKRHTDIYHNKYTVMPHASNNQIFSSREINKQNNDITYWLYCLTGGSKKIMPINKKYQLQGGYGYSLSEDVDPRITREMGDGKTTYSISGTILMGESVFVNKFYAVYTYKLYNMKNDMEIWEDYLFTHPTDGLSERLHMRHKNYKTGTAKLNIFPDDMFVKRIIGVVDLKTGEIVEKELKVSDFKDKNGNIVNVDLTVDAAVGLGIVNIAA